MAFESAGSARLAGYDQLKFWVAFRRITNVGPVRLARLYEHFGDLGLAWRAPAAELSAAGLDSRTIDYIVSQRSFVSPDAELDSILEAGFDVITLADERYPARLAEIYAPPPVLFVRGALKASDDLAVAVVGTRRNTTYGRQATSRLVRELVRAGVTIVSGLARGIDSLAHEAALEAGGRTIAVLAHGPHTIYPPENRGLAKKIVEQGALVTEYPIGVQPEPGNFPARNRIIAGLSLGAVVVEAGERSGALITTELASQMGREVFAVPGPITAPSSVGCNWLIQQQGAKLVMSAADILDELKIDRIERQTEMRKAIPLSEYEQTVLKGLTDSALHIDELGRKIDLRAPVISSTLMILELKGLVRHLGGMVYERG